MDTSYKKHYVQEACFLHMQEDFHSTSLMSCWLLCNKRALSLNSHHFACVYSQGSLLINVLENFLHKHTMENVHSMNGILGCYALVCLERSSHMVGN